MPTLDAARNWYPQADPVHGFDHILRVYRLAERMAQSEGADLEVVCAAVLLHDAEGDQQTQQGKNAARMAHHLAAAEFAEDVLRSEGWHPDRIKAVQHCIRAHRFRDDSEQPQTIEAQVLFDADKLDAIGAIGVARAVAYAARAGQPPYAPVSQSFLESGQKEAGEIHSAYHEYYFKLRRLKERLFTASGRALAEERHAFMVDFFKRLVAEIGGEC